MPTEQLMENFNEIMTVVNGQRPNRGGKFITRVHLITPNSKEIFKINPVDFPFEDYERPEDPEAKPKKTNKKEKPKFVRTYELFRTPSV